MHQRREVDSRRAAVHFAEMDSNGISHKNKRRATVRSGPQSTSLAPEALITLAQSGASDAIVAAKSIAILAPRAGGEIDPFADA